MAITSSNTPSVVSKAAGYDSDSEASYVFASVTGGNLLVLTVVAFRWSEGNNDPIVNGVSSASGATPWSLAVRKQFRKVAPVQTDHKIEITEWYLPNSPSGTVTAVLDLYGASQTMWRMQGTRYSSAATASPLGPTNSASGAVGDTALSSGSTGTLPQADMVVRATVASAYMTSVAQGGSGYTQLGSVMSDGTNVIGFDIQEKVVSATTAQSETWARNGGVSDPGDQGWAGVITSYKGATVNKRIEVTGIDTAVNGTTGWDVRHWLTDTDGSTFRKVSGVAAEASGGVIYITGGTVPDVADGTTVNVVLWRPGASPVMAIPGVVVGTVKVY